jgi:hypothetical protein
MSKDFYLYCINCEIYSSPIYNTNYRYDALATYPFLLKHEDHRFRIACDDEFLDDERGKTDTELNEYNIFREGTINSPEFVITDRTK